MSEVHECHDDALCSYFTVSFMVLIQGYLNELNSVYNTLRRDVPDHASPKLTM